MKIHIPASAEAPATDLFVKVLKKEPETVDQTARSVLFLIPGGPGGNHTLYADIEDILFLYTDLVIVDLRGCGYSDPCETRFCTLTQHIHDLESVRISLNLDSIMIHGCSYGAMVALGYAIYYPENLSKLILSSGAASGDFIESAKKNLSVIGSSLQIDAAKTLWAGEFSSPEEFANYYKIMAPLYIFSHAPSEAPPTTKYNIPYNIDLVNLAFTTFLKTFNFIDFLHNVKAKTLIISGENDWITDTKQAEILHSGIPGSCLVIFLRCGHFPWRDQSSKFLTCVQSFIQNDTVTLGL